MNPQKEFKFCPYCGAKIGQGDDRNRCEGCIAFAGGKCCVDHCKGKIVRIHKNQYSQEHARKFYTIASKSFDYYFGPDFEDEDLEE